MIVNAGYRGKVGAAVPKFTYTGKSNIRKDGVVELLTSGTIVFLEPKVIDVFMVGGGGMGGFNGTTGGSNYYSTNGGGGGGYTRTVRRIKAQGTYQITVGEGATGTGADGGSTAWGTTFAVAGGVSSRTQSSAPTSSAAQGRPGGSGGGGGVISNSDYGTGGSDGNNGEQGYFGPVAGGTGQGFTTREFGEATGKLYAGGGGGGRAMQSNTPIISAGGSGGGGAGGFQWLANNLYQAAGAGGANTGGGGGGSVGSYNVGMTGGSGGSGIVCFREAQELPELAGTWVLNARLYPSQTGASINEVISYQGVTPQGNFTGYSIGIGATANATVAFYLNASTIYAQYQFSNNTWVVSKPSPVQTITFPAGATASDEFRAWLASNATKQ